MQKLLVLLVLSAPLFFTNCGNDDDGANNPDCVTLYNNDVTEASSNISAAAMTFANDPTVANCQAYVQTLEDWLDVLDTYDNCAGLNQVEYQQSVDQARQSLEEARLDCI